MKIFSQHLPFGTRENHIKEIIAADLDKLEPQKDLQVLSAHVC
jgi:hypothetical protein